jgi:hypothetical protein
MKKSARGGPDRVDEKNNFLGGSARMGASPAFMEYRSAKKDRGSHRRLFGPEQRKKHAAVDVLSEKEGSPSCGYPVVRGEGEKRQFLLREKKTRNARYSKTLVGRMKKNRLTFTQLPF